MKTEDDFHFTGLPVPITKLETSLDTDRLRQTPAWQALVAAQSVFQRLIHGERVKLNRKRRDVFRKHYYGIEQLKSSLERTWLKEQEAQEEIVKEAEEDNRRHEEES